MLLDKKGKLTQKEKSSFSFRLKSIIASGIAFVFILVLAVSFGQVPGCKTDMQNSLATVAGRQITPNDNDLNYYVKALRKRSDEVNPDNVVTIALNRVIWDTLLLEAARENDIEVSMEMVKSLLLSHIKQQNITRQTFASYPRRYRQRVEDQLSSDFMRRVVQFDIRSAGKLTDLEFNITEKLSRYLASVQVAIMDTRRLVDTGDPDEASLKSFFNKNKAAYENLLRASHILVEDEATARKLRQTLTRDNFAAIARQESTDKMSKGKGGELGWFFPDRMIEEFSRAALKLKPGEISQPVKTTFGYHLILLQKKKSFTDFADLDQEARGLLAESYTRDNQGALQEEADKKADALIRQLRQMVNSGQNFAAAARNLNLEVIQTGLFRFMEAPGPEESPLAAFGESADFHLYAFSQKPGSVSPLIKSGNYYAVLSPLEQKQEKSELMEYAADPDKFEALPAEQKQEFREQMYMVRAQMQEQLRRRLFQDWSQTLYELMNVQINQEMLEKISR